MRTRLYLSLPLCPTASRSRPVGPCKFRVPLLRHRNVDLISGTKCDDQQSIMSTSSQPPVPIGAETQSDGKTGGSTSEEAPANAVGIASKKEAPPESAESIRLRIWVIASFWATIIFVGLPIWWRTTTIHRENLPLSQMMDWADGRV